MTNPRPDQIQAMTELITELLGWKKMCCDNQLKYPHWHVKEQCFLGGGPPNWPGDRRESYELLKDYNINFKSSAVISAYDESMLFLELKGYRWVECENMCVDGLYQPTPDPESTTKCPCNGQGGKFVKEVTDG